MIIIGVQVQAWQVTYIFDGLLGNALFEPEEDNVGDSHCGIWVMDCLGC